MDGTEIFDITGLESSEVKPRQNVRMKVTRKNGETVDIQLTLRIDTPIEIEYYRHGGILQYVLRELLEDA